MIVSQLYLITIIELPKMYNFTSYFEQRALLTKTYLTKSMCIYVIETFEQIDDQKSESITFWAKVPDLNGKYLRVITKSDFRTIHNAFIDYFW